MNKPHKFNYSRTYYFEKQKISVDGFLSAKEIEHYEHDFGALISVFWNGGRIRTV